MLAGQAFSTGVAVGQWLVHTTASGGAVVVGARVSVVAVYRAKGYAQAIFTGSGAAGPAAAVAAVGQIGVHTALDRIAAVGGAGVAVVAARGDVTGGAHPGQAGVGAVADVAVVTGITI